MDFQSIHPRSSNFYEKLKTIEKNLIEVKKFETPGTVLMPVY